MKRSALLILLVFCMHIQAGFSKKITIKVLEEGTNDPIPFAPVMLSSTCDTVMTSTNFNGEANVDVQSEKYQLKVVSVGYESFEKMIVIADISKEKTVTLVPAIYVLECITITDYCYQESYVDICCGRRTVCRDEWCSVCCRIGCYEVEETDSAVIATVPEPDVRYLRTYPNPASDLVTIETSDESNEFFLYDCTGKLLQSSTVTGVNRYVFDLTSYAPGMYFVQAGKGLDAVTERIIKM